MKPCPQYTSEPNGLCHIHQYQSEYTKEMMENLTPCSTCRKTFYLPTGKVCDECKEIAKINRLKKKVAKDSLEKCKHVGKKGKCNLVRINETEYCKLHQHQLFVDKTKEDGKKLCYNHIRGCVEQLDMDYEYSKCQNCLEKERIKDAKRRGNAIQEHVAFETVSGGGVAISANTNTAMKKCTTCCIEKNASEFIGQHGLTKTCKMCRDSNKRQDRKRDHEHRLELSRIREQTVHIKYSRCERSAIEKGFRFTLTLDQYISLIQAPCHYCGDISVYDKEDKNNGDGDMDTLYKNGIDRMDNSVGYLMENCVACCKMCNYMKHVFSVTDFLKRVEHIVNYIDHKEVLYPDIFSNYKWFNYLTYKHSAKQRHLEFTLTKESFEMETKKDCYLCGKKMSEHHKNGLDRFNNSVGYTMENVRPCCRDCNYMKFKSSYDDFIKKCRQICAHNKISVSVVCDTTDIPVIEPPIENVFISTIQVNTDDLVVIQSVMVENTRQLETSANIQLEMEPEDTSNTTALVAKSTTKPPKTKIPKTKTPKTKTPKTKEEICEDAKIRKQLQIKRLKELHGEDVFKEMQAKKMAEYRKQKKEKMEKTNTQDQPK